MATREPDTGLIRLERPQLRFTSVGVESAPARTRDVSEDDAETAADERGWGTRRWLLVGGVVALVVVGGVVAALVTGFGPAPGGDSSEEIRDFPTATATPAADSGGTATASSEPRPEFAFTVDNTENCGQTCRDVTSTLENTGNETATGVTVYTRIYAGHVTSGDVIWQGTEDVGSPDPAATFTTTKRVELSLSEAATVQNNDGWITVQTTVESDQRTVTFTDERRVA